MNLIYQVNIGSTSFFDECIDSVSRYCKWYGIDHIVQTESLLDLPPHFEKLGAFSYLGEYEKVLILDADVFITRLAPNIFDCDDAEFSAVIERDLPLTPVYRDKIRRYTDENYRSLTDVDWDWDESGAEFFNTGVCLLRGTKTPSGLERFLENNYWNRTYDQTFLNWWVKSCGVDFNRLDWRWNALYGAVDDIAEAYFVHFFLSYAMPRGGAEIPEIIQGIVEFHA